MKLIYSKKNGFTLIEIIACLILTGIMGTLAGIGIIQIVRGYMFSKYNAETVQKAQLVMARMVKEFHSDATLFAGTATEIVYTNSRNPGISHRIFWDNATETIFLDEDIASSAPVILNDKVSAFDITYYDTYDGPATPFSLSTTLIEVELELERNDGIALTFGTRIFID